MTRAREHANLLAQTATGNIDLIGDGNVSIAGTLNALDVIVPLKVDGFNPSDGATNVSVSSDIRISFNNSIGIGSTGYVILKDGSNTILESISVGSTQISRTDINKTLVITPGSNFAKGTAGAANTITPVVQASFIDDDSFLGINTTGSSVTYSFQIETVELGEAYEGGYFICSGGGVQWIVSPYSAELSRNWTSRTDANTCAQTVSGCTGWFIPTVSELRNPGITCLNFWDNYSVATYWSNNEYSNPGCAYPVVFPTGGSHRRNKGSIYCVRSFRCVTY